MLKFKDFIQTVTYDGSQTEGYMYPETSYGDDVEVCITHSHKEDVDKSVSIKVGEYWLLPEQLDWMLKKVEAYKRSVKEFDK